MLPPTELQHLTSFVTAAETGTMSGAAARLSIGQAAISAHLRKLEASLGTALFDRSGRGLRLTAAGEQFLGRARAILTNAASADAEVRRFNRSIAGTLRIGLPPIAAKLVVSRLVAHALEKFPEVLLCFHEGYYWDVREWLDGAKIDIGLFYSAPGPQPEFAVPVVREELLLIGAEPVAMGEGSVDLDVIFDLPLILPGAPHGTRMRIERFAAQADKPLNVVVESDSLGALLALVESGTGYALLPEIALPTDWAERGLHVVRFNSDELSRMLMMGTSHRRPVSRLAQTFLPVLKTLFDQPISVRGNS